MHINKLCVCCIEHYSIVIGVDSKTTVFHSSARYSFLRHYIASFVKAQRL